MMTRQDYLALKAADETLDPAVSDPAQALAAIQAKTQTTPYADVSIGGIAGVLLLSGDYDKIVARSVKTPAGDASDALISLAKRAIFLMGTPQIQVVHSEDFAAFAQLMGALVAAGDISPASQAAITTMAQPTPTVAAYPTLAAATVPDLIAARSQF